MKTPDQVIRTQEREERSPRAHLGTQGCLPEAAQPPGSPLDSEGPGLKPLPDLLLWFRPEVQLQVWGLGLFGLP